MNIQEKRNAKRCYKKQKFQESFQNQFSTKKKDIINRLILLRQTRLEARKAGIPIKSIFCEYASLKHRYNCVGLPIPYPHLAELYHDDPLLPF